MQQKSNKSTGNKGRNNYNETNRTHQYQDNAPYVPALHRKGGFETIVELLNSMTGTSKNKNRKVKISNNVVYDSPKVTGDYVQLQ